MFDSLVHEVQKFKPSTKDEIDSFNLSYNDKCLIKLIDTCPFTLNSSVYKTIAFVKDEMSIKDSNYKLFFLYDNSYGIESCTSFESVKIIEKI